MSLPSKTLPILHSCLCERCIGLCCHYITIEVDKPTNKRMRDDIRWYLLHTGVTLLITRDRWSVKVPTRCMALGDDNHCTIYETRPQACREYSTENCDYHTVFEGWGTDYVEIETPAEFDLYISQHRRRRAKAVEKNT